MKIHFAQSSEAAVGDTYVPLLGEYARRDRFRVHTLADGPDDADVILFVDTHVHGDWRLGAVREHPLTRQFPDRTMVYNEKDLPWCSMPGIYVSMPRSTFDPARQRAWSYLILFNPELADSGADRQEPDLLFSFMGQQSHKCRREVLALAHSRAHIEDTSATNFFDIEGLEVDPDAHAVRKNRFVEIVRRSKFVICPRGAGTSSIRLFEVMAAGRVPVIVSDEWVPPLGPRWEDCSVRVPEAAVSRIPALLEDMEPQFEALAHEARRAYQDWFAPDVQFHRLAENCAALAEGAGSRSRRFVLDRQMLRCARRSLKGSVVAGLRTSLGAIRQKPVTLGGTGK